MARKQKPIQPPTQQTPQGANWTLLGLVAMVALTIAGVVAMVRPDAVNASGGEKGATIKIEKREAK
jgi:hypothetical protein